MIKNNCLKCTQWPKAEYQQTMKGSQKNNIWIKWENLEIDGNYKKRQILELQNAYILKDSLEGSTVDLNR